MQCMMIHDHLNKNQPKNLSKTHHILKNPKNFQKPKNLDLYVWNACRMRENKIIPVRRRSIKAKNLLGLRFKVRERCLGRWEARKDQERSREMKEKSRADPIYSNLSFSMDWELSRLKREKIAIKQLSRGVHNKRGSMDQETIEHTETSSMDREVVE